MVARVTHYRIRPGKLGEFKATAQSLTATIDKLKGFRVLRCYEPTNHLAKRPVAISIWDSAADSEGQRQ